MGIDVGFLVGDDYLDLSVVSGKEGLSRPIRAPEVNRPTLELTGFFECFRCERVQVLGTGEITYINHHLGQPEFERNLEHLFTYDIPCFLVSGVQFIPDRLIELSEKSRIPILRTPSHTTKITKRLWEVLDREFAPTTTMHGNLLDIFGIGVLVLGESGVGKSETSLELLTRGHRLIADDVVYIKCLADHILEGSGSPDFPFLMEIRGLGIVDINRSFGVEAIGVRKRIRLIIFLENWDESKEYERIGMEQPEYSILDVRLPCLTIPVKDGRNISTLIEMGALNQRLRSMGINVAEEAGEQLARAMQRTHRRMQVPNGL